MKINNLKFLFLISFTAINSFVKAQTITVGGADWNVNIPPITEAGNNYVGNYESNSSQILISLTIPGLLFVGSSANVSIHYETISLWNNNLILQRKRTGAGNNGSICIGCNVSGGDTYQNITTIPIQFGIFLFKFATWKNIANIRFHLELLEKESLETA